MARPLRVEFEDAIYHVMSRGNGGADIFIDDEDRGRWVETLGAVVKRCGWEVHAWVLMRNHYHLLVGTPEPNLVEGMRWVQQVFTQNFNRRHGRRGHVLQGRYKAQVVEGEASSGYLSTAADYIHLNPARAGLAGSRRGQVEVSSIVSLGWGHYYFGMARALRVEFEDAVYHVMSRGNGGADIFIDDEDRGRWVETLGAVVKRCGWEVHAWVLMRNHYHLLVGTPEPNLVEGMRWLQQVFTQNFNRRHGRRGHVLQGRYKAQVVEGEASSGYLSTAADYIHLNPARAGLAGRVKCGKPLSDYRWSSLSDYLRRPARRVEWMRCGRVLSAHDFSDSAAGRTGYLDFLERIAGTEKEEQMISAMRRGWIVGSGRFRQQVAALGVPILQDTSTCEIARDARRLRAEEWLGEACRQLGWDIAVVIKEPKLHWRKGLLAACLHTHCAISNRWISERLNMGHVSNISRAIHRALHAQTRPIASARRILIQNEMLKSST